MSNGLIFPMAKVWSDLKGKYVLVVFQLLITILSSLLNFPYNFSQLISQISLLSQFTTFLQISVSHTKTFFFHLAPFPPSSLHNSSFLWFPFIPSLVSFSSLFVSILWPHVPHWRSPFLSVLGSRPITSGFGSMERRRPRPSAGWSWRSPSRSSWTSLAMSRCFYSESCSTCQVFLAWSKKPPGKESHLWL